MGPRTWQKAAPLYTEKHTRRPVQDDEYDDTIRRGTTPDDCESTTNLLKVYLYYTRKKTHGSRFCLPFFRRNILFLCYSRSLHLYVTAPWFEGSRFFSRIHTGPTVRRPAHSLTDQKKSCVIFRFSSEFSFPVAVVSETLVGWRRGVGGKLFTNFFFLRTAVG